MIDAGCVAVVFGHLKIFNCVSAAALSLISKLARLRGEYWMGLESTYVGLNSTASSSLNTHMPRNLRPR